MNEELTFIFGGLAWIGVSALVLAGFIGIRRLYVPKPKPLASSMPGYSKWERDWNKIEEDLRK
jgi:hypothetical protein